MQTVYIEDFEDDDVGNFPSGWIKSDNLAQCHIAVSDEDKKTGLKSCKFWNTGTTDAAYCRMIKYLTMGDVFLLDFWSRGSTYQASICELHIGLLDINSVGCIIFAYDELVDQLQYHTKVGEVVTPYTLMTFGGGNPNRADWIRTVIEYSLMGQKYNIKIYNLVGDLVASQSNVPYALGNENKGLYFAVENTATTTLSGYYYIDGIGGSSEISKKNIHDRIEIISMDKLISGTIRKSPNSANTCELTFHNPGGEKTYQYKHGDNIRFYAGLGYAYREPLFDGYIYDIYKDASPSNLPIKINCLDYIGKLQEERILLNETTNYDGWENISAIKDIVTNCTGDFFTNFSIQGSSDKEGNIQTITSENNVRSDYESRLELIKKINNFTYDDSNYPNAPKLYYFWQENDWDDTIGEVRRFCFKKITANAGDMTAIKTLDYGNTIFDSSLREQTQGCINTAIVKGTDAEYTHSDSTGIYNFLDGVQAQKIDDSTLVNSDDCQKKAIRFVELFKKPQKSIQVRCRDGFMLKPLDVVKVVNPRYGINENFFIIDVDITFSSNEINTVLTLGTQRPYITSYL